MNLISKHLDKNNLHHAYLIEGARDNILPELHAFIESLGVATVGNPDFCLITTDSFRVEDARSLKSFGGEMGFSDKEKSKKIFVISTNNLLLEAQNTLLKIFEEPIENTHFFLVVPDVNTLLKTLVSRFYVIKKEQSIETDSREANEFIKMPLKSRIDFLKELLAEEEDDEVVVADGARSRALLFLNELETILRKKIILNTKPRQDLSFFDQIFKAREFIRQPGSSVKSLMESVALVVPELK